MSGSGTFAACSGDDDLRCDGGQFARCCTTNLVSSLGESIHATPELVFSLARGSRASSFVTNRRMADPFAFQ